MATFIKNQDNKNQQLPTEEVFVAKGHRWSVFGAGVFAGGIMTVLMVVLLYTGISKRSLANLVADRIAAFFPADLTESVIQGIGQNGKNILFYSVLVGQGLFGGLLALLMFWLFPRIVGRQELWRNCFLIATGLWFVLMIGGLPLLNAGLLGVELAGDQIPFILLTFALFQVYGVALGFFILQLVPTSQKAIAIRPSNIVVSDEDDDEDDEDENDEQPGVVRNLTRRRLVVGMTVFFVAALGAGLGFGAFRPNSSVYRASLGDIGPDGRLLGAITPAESFYKVSKNTIDPNVNAADWKMEINGLVGRTLNFDYNTIRQQPAQTVYHTLTCISNTVGGDLIGNSKWKGTGLKGLLEQAGVKPGAKRVIFTCADGYKDSITIEKALEPDTVLAWEQNDTSLVSGHGYPVRMLIPNIYGMKNAKWVTQITVVDTDFRGYWQERGWDNEATIQTQSTITFPEAGGMVKAGEKIAIKGFAFAGSRGIKRVEVSTDGGASWQDAQVQEALSRNSWQIWRLEWTPQGTAQTYNLKVRATDGTGEVQTKDRADSYPSGATGWHSISVSVVSAK